MATRTCFLCDHPLPKPTFWQRVWGTGPIACASPDECMWRGIAQVLGQEEADKMRAHVDGLL